MSKKDVMRISGACREEQVECLCAHMVEKGEELHMGMFAGSWKGVSNQKGKALRGILKDLGRSIGLRMIDGRYCMYNGMCYDVIDERVIFYAFQDMLDHFDMPMWTLKGGTYYKDCLLRSIEDRAMVSDCNLVGFRNGILDLRGGKIELKPFSEEFPVTYIHGYRYDAESRCPKWQGFLREVLPDKTQRSILQMSMGLGLLNRYEIGKLEQCLVLFGNGGNGKGVVYETMKGLFGQELFSSLGYKPLTDSGDAGMRARYALRGKVFNWCPDDSADFMKGNASEFKRLVSGEPVNDRGIGMNVSENRKLPYIVFNTNTLPRVDDVGDGMMRRLQVVCFDKKIEASRKNPMLAKELEKEYSGIFNWVLRGMREIRRRKFLMPSSRGGYVANLVIRLSSNPASVFGEVYNIRGEARVSGEIYEKVPVKTLYGCYRRFCEANAVEPQTIQAFGRIMNSYFGAVAHSSTSGRCYYLYGFRMSDLEREISIKDMVYDDGYKQAENRYIQEED